MTIWDKLTKVVFGLLCIALILLVALSYVPLIRQNERMGREVLRLETELQKERENNRQIRQAVEAMQSDPKAVERMAREKLGLAKPGETVVRFEEPATNGTAQPR
jgi:cell division protein FtsB